MYIRFHEKNLAVSETCSHCQTNTREVYRGKQDGEWVTLCPKCVSQPSSQPWENPGPNARYCPVCGAMYLAGVFKRVAVGVWDKRMPCGHVERVVDPGREGEL